MVVYAQEPRFLNKLSKNVKTLEVDDKISESVYKVSFTGEKKEKNFSTFGETLIYNRQHASRNKSKKNLDKLNATPVSFTKAFSFRGCFKQNFRIKRKTWIFYKGFHAYLGKPWINGKNIS